MRAGGATALAECTTASMLIQTTGRWTSDTFNHYVCKNPFLFEAVLFGHAPHSSHCLLTHLTLIFMQSHHLCLTSAMLPFWTSPGLTAGGGAVLTKTQSHFLWEWNAQMLISQVKRYIFTSLIDMCTISATALHHHARVPIHCQWRSLVFPGSMSECTRWKGVMLRLYLAGLEFRKELPPFLFTNSWAC